MVNCNPETVSTDYDTSDRLYFEPLTAEDVLAVYEAEVAAGPVAGVICQLGGQTPLGLAQTLKDAGVPVVGTSPRRSTWRRNVAPLDVFLMTHHFRRPPMDWPAVSIRPKRLPLGSATQFWSGLRMCSAVEGWKSSTTMRCSPTTYSALRRRAPEHPVPLTGSSMTRSRSTSTPCTTARSCFWWGHGTHRGGRSSPGDSACALPPITLSRTEIMRVRRSTEAIAKGVGVRGLLNVQYALAGECSTFLRPTLEHRAQCPSSRRRRSVDGEGCRSHRPRRNDR